ncbi:FKBP-type peptidyl-prolyl cis-trans isomerase [Xanthomonas citri]|uniref:FKBP-type peptidyl-prolyl cis-trans isomerase n=1 Tax=Xanthomonas citri TaxID=346 RepID=UPI001884EB8A|nr:FKBP-type peptidyl-prolyl cis-trans isomerase [Xanthomonas citri]QOY21945.1 FKBP-type peptidyl-prolyl cis-trans isomerase [Xanthomonas citri]QQK68086.1 FKBP-type peptidyl-prolyl cis-trans isomerase [Xanthomonas citri]
MRLLLTLVAALSLASCAPALPASGGTIASFERIDRSVGTGAEAIPGAMVTVHYTGWLYDEKAADKHGKKFDSSLDRAEPFQFVLGGHQVIRGWDDGVAGMRIGGKRTLMIPPDYGYGDNGAGGVIPPGASLVFDVELLGVQPR